MLYIALAICLGLGVGYFSYAFQKAFFALMAAVIPIFGIVYFKVLLPLAKVTGGAAGLGHGDPITLIMALIGQLPQDMQSAIIIFPMAAFGGRLLTWIYAKFIAKEAGEESQADRRKRILQQYGYKDGLPY